MIGKIGEDNVEYVARDKRQCFNGYFRNCFLSEYHCHEFIYGVVRHPMYLGGIVMFFSHILLGQNWIVAISTIVAIACCYLIILSEDQRNIEKFGDEYIVYMQSVPRMNLLLGIVKSLMRRRRGGH